jgi:choline-sulfatase
MGTRPNILLLLSDEHSPLELGCMGGRLVRTPNLDALAARGATFDATYCQSPMCVPSRLSFLTGKYCWRIGAWSNAEPVPSGETSIMRFLGWHGYRTASIGKMHFLGEDQFWGFQYRPYGDFFGDSHQADPLKGAPRHTMLPVGPSEIPEELLQETIVTQLGLEFLERHEEQQPFFLALSYNHPHFPVCPPERLWKLHYPDAGDLPDFGPGFPDSLHPWMQFHRHFYSVDRWTEEDFRRFRAGYRACVHLVDEHVGRVLAALDQHGLRENTVVIYTSDHGDMNGEHGMMRKGNFYDPSVRVPLIISRPGTLPEGRRVPDIAELTDLFPTIAELAGLPAPHDLDGHSLVPLLQTGDGGGRKGYAISESYTHGVPGPMRMIRLGDWKYNLYLDAKPSLFNLREDPQEFHDRIGDGGETQRVARECDRLLRTDWDEGKIRSIYKPVLTVAENQNRRPQRTPNQYLTPEGRYVDAETFYKDVDWSIGAI